MPLPRDGRGEAGQGVSTHSVLCSWLRDPRPWLVGCLPTDAWVLTRAREKNVGGLQQDQGVELVRAARTFSFSFAVGFRPKPTLSFLRAERSGQHAATLGPGPSRSRSSASVLRCPAAGLHAAG